MIADKLYFGNGNAKLATSIATFSLPAGWACPCAKDCQSRTDKLTGKITDGKHTQFRCFSATNEARATSVRFARHRNWDLLKQAKTAKAMAELIDQSLPFPCSYVRIHVSGDFFNREYFKAWVIVAKAHPEIIFYGYTKTIRFWLENKADMPSNFRLVASWGGTEDRLIGDLPSAKVVFSVAEAAELGLEIDHDDSHAIKADKSFALLLHATQPVGTVASEAWNKIRKTIGGYDRKRSRKAATSIGAKALAGVTIIKTLDHKGELRKMEFAV